MKHSTLSSSPNSGNTFVGSSAIEVTHIVCFSGGESSAKAAVEVVRKYGKENVILLNHNINPRFEDADIKRFKEQVANYLGLHITYANIDDISKDSAIPSQFHVCVLSGAMTDFSGNALCTARLKTEPFFRYLSRHFEPIGSLFYKPCIIYYGFDSKETIRMQRRTGILGAMGYKTDYPMIWKERTIYSIREIGIEPPLTYKFYQHANCKGCLKASLLHWYVVYVNDILIYNEGIWMENELDFTIHTVIRNKVKTPISLTELAPIFERMRIDGIEATEHQSKQKFANKIKAYQLEECSTNKPCECLA